MALDEVVHHGDELLVAGLWIPHHHAQHVQYEAALGIHQVLVGAPGADRIQARPHVDGTGVVGAEAERILVQDRVTRVLQEFEIAVRLGVGEL